MERGVIRYKLNELRMMLNDGEHTEEQRILVDIINELDKCVLEREKGTNGEIIKAIFPEGNEFDIKKYQYKAWTAKNKSDFSVEMSVEFWNAEYKGSFAVPEREKGTWECYSNTNSGVCFFECSCCHTTHADNSDFCPDCGADMRGGN